MLTFYKITEQLDYPAGSDISPLRVLYTLGSRAIWHLYTRVRITAAAAMVCLFHGDYGPADPAFRLDLAATADGRGWSVDASLLKEARNIGEAEAIERHLIRGETVSWCDQGYAWVEQDAMRNG